MVILCKVNRYVWRCSFILNVQRGRWCMRQNSQETFWVAERKWVWSVKKNFVGVLTRYVGGDYILMKASQEPHMVSRIN
jgi:hypothetical protein